MLIRRRIKHDITYTSNLHAKRCNGASKIVADHHYNILIPLLSIILILPHPHVPPRPPIRISGLNGCGSLSKKI